MATTQAQLTQAFGAWLLEGQRVSALDHAADYRLHGGSASNGVAFAIVVETDGRTRGDVAHFPYLGRTKSSALTVLEAQTEAWRMIDTRRHSH